MCVTIKRVGFEICNYRDNLKNSKIVWRDILTGFYKQTSIQIDTYGHKFWWLYFYSIHRLTLQLFGVCWYNNTYEVDKKGPQVLPEIEK